MQPIGNWYLTYRGPEQLQTLLAAADLPAAACELACETIGAQAFLRISKPAPR